MICVERENDFFCEGRAIVYAEVVSSEKPTGEKKYFCGKIDSTGLIAPAKKRATLWRPLQIGY